MDFAPKATITPFKLEAINMILRPVKEIIARKTLM